MNELILKYGFGWIIGILIYVLFALYWTLRTGQFIVREPNLFILIFEITHIAFALFIMIYSINQFFKNK